MEVNQASLVKRTGCLLCDDFHPIYFCKRFRRMSYEKRLRVIIVKELCSNCLEKGHRSSECPSESRCHLCSEMHHSLIHEHKRPLKDENCLVRKTELHRRGPPNKRSRGTRNSSGDRSPEQHRRGAPPRSARGNSSRQSKAGG